jgi:hypothetical protein
MRIVLLEQDQGGGLCKYFLVVANNFAEAIQAAEKLRPGDYTYAGMTPAFSGDGPMILSPMEVAGKVQFYEQLSISVLQP